MYKKDCQIILYWLSIAWWLISTDFGWVVTGLVPWNLLLASAKITISSFAISSSLSRFASLFFRVSEIMNCKIFSKVEKI